MEHKLKTWPGPFAAVIDESKSHEIRKADRPYAAGDTLWLCEWDPETLDYTGREATADVTYVTPGGEWGIPVGLCVMSIWLTGYHRQGRAKVPT